MERNWGATTALTEPDAGSDVGAGRTKAIEQPDGTWHLDGVKRFITTAAPTTCSKTSSTSCWDFFFRKIALGALDGEVSDRDRAFYTGKVAVAKFFAKNVLPRLRAERKIVDVVDLTAMELREEAF